MADNHETVLLLLRDIGKQVALSDLKARLDVPERTLNRWLAKLVEAGQVQATGQKRGRRYHLPSSDVLSTPLPATHPLFSAPALALINRVRQPLITRDPCTYNTAWFDAYQPNQTFYLPAGQRQRLMQQGRQVSAELPAGTYAQRIFNRLLVDLSYNSSRLEGNTYSLPDTEKLLLEGVMFSTMLLVGSSFTSQQLAMGRTRTNHQC